MTPLLPQAERTGSQGKGEEGKEEVRGDTGMRR